jgi:Glycosyltransferase sugar-binding region containing DXD motif
MILASILIAAEGHEDQDLPQKVVENIDSFKRCHPGLEHKLFRGAAIRYFISEKFGGEVLSAYDRLMPFAYKSDLARYCIMYEYGGVYADLSIYFLKGWPPQSLAELPPRFQNVPPGAPRLAVFRDFTVTTPWETAISIFFTPPRHKAMQAAIKLLCENVRKGYYGNSSLCPTGPTLFGKAVAISCDPEDIITGESNRYEPPKGTAQTLVTERSQCFVFNRALVAIRRKRGTCPMSELGVQGGNEYHKMWVARQIYADQQQKTE